MPNATPLVDITGDGLAEVFFSRYLAGGGNELTILPGGPGGSFGAPLTFVLPAAVEGLAFGDNDGDGLAELATLYDQSPLIGSSIFARWWDWNGTSLVASAPVALPPAGLGGGFAYEPLRRFVGVRLAGFADLDGDGDPDGMGSRAIAFRRFDGGADGGIRQFGQGTAGSGGVVPVLGAAGPLRPGSATAELRMRRGSSVALLLVGGSETALSDFAGLGVTLYAGPPVSIIALPMVGPPGVPGAGSFGFGLIGLLPGLAGQQAWLQFGVLDAGAPLGVAASNGLELTFGL